MHGLASPGQLRASRWRWIAVCVPLVVVLGFLSGAVAGNGGAWYAMLDKPAITPPGWVFPVAWTILYILQGVALALVLSASGARGRAVAAALFALQLALNVAWSPVFFGWHRPGPAFWVLVATLLTAVAATDGVRPRPDGGGVADGALPRLAGLRRRPELHRGPDEPGRRRPCARARQHRHPALNPARQELSMQSQNKFFEDLAKVMNGAAGTLAGMGREGEASMRARAREWLGGDDAVSREEFEAVRALATAARTEVDGLKARLDALDGGASAAGAEPLKPGAIHP